MSDDLRGALHALHASHERESAALLGEPGAEVDRLSRRIRRRRAARATTTGIATLAAILVVAVGAAAVTGRWEAPRPATTAPAPTTSTSPPSPTPTPTPTPDPTPDDEPTVTSNAWLPEAGPMRAGVLAQTDERWHMVEYYSPDESHPDVLYLVDPDGALVEVPTPGDVVPSDVTSWLPGTQLVVVGSRVLDLLSGATLADFGAADGAAPSVRFVGDGTTDVLVDERVTSAGSQTRTLHRAGSTGNRLAEIALPGGQMPVVSPDGSQMAVGGSDGVQVVDLASMLVSWAVPAGTPPGACTPWAWLGAELVVSCWDESAGGSLWLVADGAAPRRVVEADPGGESSFDGLSSPVLHLGDTLVFGSGSVGDFNVQMWQLTADSTAVELPPLPSPVCSDVAIAGRFVCLIETYSGPDGAGTHDEVGSLDPLTGDDQVVVDVVDPERSRMRLIGAGGW